MYDGASASGIQEEEMKNRRNVWICLLVAMFMLPALASAQPAPDRTNPGGTRSDQGGGRAPVAATSGDHPGGQLRPGRPKIHLKKHVVREGRRDIRSGSSEEMRTATRKVDFACENEANLLCKGKKGDSRIRCLNQNERSALGGCRDALEGLRAAETAEKATTANSGARSESRQRQGRKVIRHGRKER